MSIGIIFASVMVIFAINPMQDMDDFVENSVNEEIINQRGSLGAIQESNYREVAINYNKRLQEISDSHNSLWNRWENKEITAEDYSKTTVVQMETIINLAEKISINVPQEWEEFSKYARYHVTEYLSYLQLTYMYAKGVESGSLESSLTEIERAMTNRLDASDHYLALAKDTMPET